MEALRCGCQVTPVTIGYFVAASATSAAFASLPPLLGSPPSGVEHTPCAHTRPAPQSPSRSHGAKSAPVEFDALPHEHGSAPSTPATSRPARFTSPFYHWSTVSNERDGRHATQVASSLGRSATVRAEFGRGCELHAASTAKATL